MAEERRYCRKCLLEDGGTEGRVMLDRYLGAIRDEDKVSSKVYRKRLDICRGCERLADDGTCLSCGCYVEFRAVIKTGRCPKLHWK